MNPGLAGFEFYNVQDASAFVPLGRKLQKDWEVEGEIKEMPEFRFRSRRMVRGMTHQNFPQYIHRHERDFFYRAIADIGACLAKERAVIFDATANRRAYRDRARAAIKRFAEVYVSTPLEVCAARDTKGLYKSKNVKTLPGVQSAYEVPLAPELVVSGASGTPEDGAAEVMALLERRGWLPRAGVY